MGGDFKIITDHAALKWLITMRNHQCARLNMWVLKLSEYDFEIQHRPGNKHINADILSRHVAAAVRKHTNQDDGTDARDETEVDVSVSRKEIGKAQNKDEFCQQVRDKLLQGDRLPYFYTEIRSYIMGHLVTRTQEGQGSLFPYPYKGK
jgi:hypothetical protein